MRAVCALALFVFLGACARISDAEELGSIAQARSVAAEWALVNQQLDRHQVTQLYADQIRSSVRDQMASLGQGFTDQQSPQAAEVRALLALQDDAPPAEILAHAASLKRIETSRESA